MTSFWSYELFYLTDFHRNRVISSVQRSQRGYSMCTSIQQTFRSIQALFLRQNCHSWVLLSFPNWSTVPKLESHSHALTPFVDLDANLKALTVFPRDGVIFELLGNFQTLTSCPNETVFFLFQPRLASWSKSTAKSIEEKQKRSFSLLKCERRCMYLTEQWKSSKTDWKIWK